VDLQTQIALRLYSNYCCVAITADENWDALPKEYQQAWLINADEVIRQMQWAQRIGIKECEEADDYSWAPYVYPITLAPDDWKP
jgi:hypothetical protein